MILIDISFNDKHTNNNVESLEFDFQSFKVQGIEVNYYYVCKRKLWLFDKGISMESESDAVLEGKLIHENAYPKAQTREVMIDDLLKIDIIEGDYIKDVKKSSKMRHSDAMQIAYYLFYLKQMGVMKKGTINYVKERKIEKIELTEDLENEIKNALVEINKILDSKRPPQREKLPHCQKCAYYLFCYVEELENET